MMIGAPIVEKLGKLFPRLASEHDGEVVATARAIQRVLERNGGSLHDLAGALRPVSEIRSVRPAPASKKRTNSTRKAAAEAARPINPGGNVTGVLFEDVILCATYLLGLGSLNEKETDFVDHLLTYARKYRAQFKLTEKQRDWWHRLLMEHGLEQKENAA